jgi:hypothetical protein
MRHILLRSLCVAVLFLPSICPAGDVVFEEILDSPGTGWKNVLKRGQPVVKPMQNGESALRINNHVLGHALSTPLKEYFKIEVETLHGEDGAFLWFGLFDPLLEKGYAVGWSNPPQDHNNAYGRLGVYKVRLEPGDKPEILFKNPAGSRQAEVLGNEVKSPHATLAEPPAKLKLVWNKADGSLVLSCDGEELVRVVDSDITEFEGVLLSGNKKSIYRSVKIEGK